MKYDNCEGKLVWYISSCFVAELRICIAQGVRTMLSMVSLYELVVCPLI